MTDHSAPPALTPSEILLVNGEALFPAHEKLMAFDLPRGKKVEPEPAAVLALQAAVYGNEKAGVLRVEEFRGSRFFGLLKTKEVRMRALPGGALPWPDGTLEARIAGIVAAGGGDGVTSRALLAGLIPDMHAIPDTMILHEIAAGLVTRGFAERRKMRVKIDDYEYEPTLTVLGERGEAVARSHGIEQVSALLDAARAERRELAERLDAGLRKGLRARRASAGAALLDLPDQD